ncbi:polysaccharide biosynthesis protein (plasmid) [Companilactobacillus farciminis]|jgi:Membrane protein involved in the export of O-antigen and teichoic acid|nr:polysaccharide biosynthesis protein [Companilactobacillus farciminis]
MKELLKKFMGFSLGPVIGAFISFITVPITTYFISPSEFGKASMFTVIQGLVATFVYLGIDQSYTREFNYISDKKKLFQNALIVPIAFSVIVGILLLFFSRDFSRFLFNSGKYTNITVLFVIMVIFMIIERFILLSIRMNERALEYSFFSVILKLIIFILTLIYIFNGRRDFLTIVYSNIFGQIAGDIILLIKYRGLFVFSSNWFDRKLVKRMIIFGLPLIVSASLNNLLNTTDRFFLRGFSNYNELGIYTAALKIAAVLQLIQTSFTTFWTPTAYRWNKEGKNIEYFNFMSDIVLLIFTVLFFCILQFKKYIVLILSSQYSDAQYVAGLLLLPIILYTLSETSTLGIVFSGKSYYNVFVSIIAFVPNVILNFLFVPNYGTRGAALATGISYMLFCFSRTYFSRKEGFTIDFKVQSIVIIIFLIAAIFSSLRTRWSFYVIDLLFVLCVLIQFGTLSKIVKIKKNPRKWDFK